MLPHRRAREGNVVKGVDGFRFVVVAGPEHLALGNDPEPTCEGPLPGLRLHLPLQVRAHVLSEPTRECSPCGAVVGKIRAEQVREDTAGALKERHGNVTRVGI